MNVTPRFESDYIDQNRQGTIENIIGKISLRAKLFVDVGAHYGFYSLLAANANPEIEIVALEAVPETFLVLERNVSPLGPRASIHRVAASGTTGTADFFVSRASDECGLAPTVPPPLRSIQVETATLDRLLRGREPCPAIVKIDATGSEAGVVAGMHETLERFDDITLIVAFNPNLLADADRSPEQLLSQISGLGFEIFMVPDRSRQSFRVKSAGDWRALLGDSGAANLICVKRDRALSLCLFAHSAGLGGAQRSLARLVEQLVSGFGAMCCVVLPHNGPLVEMLHSAGATTIVSRYRWWCAKPIDPKANQHWTGWMAESVDRVLGQVAPLVRKIDPDVVWTQTLVIPWGAVTAAAIGKPHVWSVTEFGERDHGMDFCWPLERVVADVEATSAIVFTSSKAIAAELFPNAPQGKVRLRYPPVTVPSTLVSELEPKPLENPGATTRIGIFSLISPSKGQEDAVRAAARLARDHDVELLVAGAINDQSYHQHLLHCAESLGIAARVHFVGHLANPYPAMRACDIVVVCSRNEALGRIAIEASQVGTPVVYAAAGGMLETMIDGETGLAYPPGDIDRLVGCLERLIADPELRRRLSTKGALNAISRFGGEREAREVFAALLGMRHGAVLPAAMPRVLEASVKHHQAAAANDDLRRARSSAEAALAKTKVKLNPILDSWIGRVLAATRLLPARPRTRKQESGMGVPPDGQNAGDCR
jgi:FkbM family methyltransferase